MKSDIIFFFGGLVSDRQYNSMHKDFRHPNLVVLLKKAAQRKS